jgi:hypothetical protein
MHGTIVVKDSVLAEHPWIAQSLYKAFDQAKKEWLARLDAGEATTATDKKYLELRKIVGTTLCRTASRKTARPSKRWNRPHSSRG